MWRFFKNILHTRRVDDAVGRTEKCVILFDTHAAFKRVSVVYMVWREKKWGAKQLIFLKSLFANDAIAVNLKGNTRRINRQNVNETKPVSNTQCPKWIIQFWITSNTIDFKSSTLRILDGRTVLLRRQNCRQLTMKRSFILKPNSICRTDHGLSCCSLGSLSLTPWSLFYLFGPIILLRARTWFFTL